MGKVYLDAGELRHVNWPKACPNCDAALGPDEPESHSVKISVKRRIGSIFASKLRSEFQIPLCENCFDSYTRMNNIKNSGSVIAGACFVGVIIFSPGNPTRSLLYTATLLGLIASAIGNFLCRRAGGTSIMQTSKDTILFNFRGEKFSKDFREQNS